MQRCAVYARVSTDMQGESLENQVEYAQEYIRRLGDAYELAAACVYTDFDQSGYYTRFLQRPAIQRALGDAQARKFDVIVFKEISRISRDQAEHVEVVSRFTQYGVRIIAINDNLDSDRPETLDLLGIHSVMAEMESKRISSRVSSGKKMLARRGMWMGEAPIGYVLNRDTHQLEIDFTQKEIVETIFRLYTAEDYGTFRIAAYLNDREMRTKNGRLWSRGTVGQVLRNPAYVGDLVYGKTRNTLKRIFDDRGYTKVQGRNEMAPEDWIVVTDTHPAIISREMFEQAQVKLRARRKQNPGRSRHPLTGILVCAECGAGMVCQKQRYQGREYRYYTCSRAFRFGRQMCQQPNVPADKIEQALWRWILRLLEAYKEMTVNTEPTKQAAGERDTRLRQLRRQLQKAELGLERLLMESDMPRQSYTQLKDNYLSTIQTITAEMDECKRTATDLPVRAQTFPVQDYLYHLQASDLSDLDFTRAFLHSLVEYVVVKGREVTHIGLKYRGAEG
ncbi:recombinase family protein [Alicyclobacillus fodiniaquatilis]|uniref:Recombinase family protein n=1 Tax=Alicyclobacillus fodiniaquatilis TaxID=1661150 RepID=A0ABW4JQD5_9BACL